MGFFYQHSRYLLLAIFYSSSKSYYKKLGISCKNPIPFAFFFKYKVKIDLLSSRDMHSCEAFYNGLSVQLSNCPVFPHIYPRFTQVNKSVTAFTCFTFVKDLCLTIRINPRWLSGFVFLLVTTYGCRYVFRRVCRCIS